MLTDTAEYALRAVLHLARRPAGRRVPSARVAEVLDLPANYLSKTMRTLAKEEVLDAVRGPGGGFSLARPPAEITLSDVVDPFLDLGGREQCLLGDRTCEEREPCAAHARWQELTGHVEAFFGRTTVADLLAAEQVGDAEEERAGGGPVPAAGPDEHTTSTTEGDTGS